MKLRTFLGTLPSGLMLVFGAGCLSGWLIARTTLTGWVMVLGWAVLLAIVAGSVRECAARLWQRVGAEPEALRYAVEAMAQGNLTAVGSLPAPRFGRSLCEALHELSQRLHGRMASARGAAHRLERALDAAETRAAACGPAQQGLPQVQQVQQALDGLVHAACELQRQADAGQQRATALAGWGRRCADAATRLSHEQQLGQRRNARVAEIAAAIETNAVQTHLLALQAALEASRDGERGRGVQLIGNEVRVLSQRGRYAARQLRELVPTLLQPPLPAEGAPQELPAMAAVLSEQLAEQAEAARGLQRAAAAAQAAVGTLAERLAPLDAWLAAQVHDDALEPPWLEALRIEVEQVSEALSVFYLGTDPPALGSAVAPADPQAGAAAPGAAVAPASPGAPLSPSASATAPRTAGAPGQVLRADPFLTH